MLALSSCDPGREDLAGGVDDESVADASRKVFGFAVRNAGARLENFAGPGRPLP